MVFATYNKNEYRNGYLVTIISMIIVLSYCLSQYKSIIPGITIGELCLIICVAVLIIYYSGKIYVFNTRVFVIYYAIALVSSIIALTISNPSFYLVSLGELLTRWVRYFIYIVFYVFCCDVLCDKKRIIRVYRVISLAIAIYAILQYCIYLTFHVYLPVNILPIAISRDVDTESLIQVAQSSYMRARGIFVEPGYLAKFLLPGIVLSFCGWDRFENDKVDWISILIISVAVLMSGSVQGIIILIVSFALVALSQRELTAKNLINIIIGILSVMILYIISQRTGFLVRPMNRIVHLLYGSEIDRSAQLRVLRGFAYWWQLPLEHKIFGVGMGNAANYAFDFNIYTSFDYYYRREATLEYMSGISSIMVTHGIFCLGIFVFMLVKFKRVMGKSGYMIFLQYVILLFGGGVFLSVLGVLYFSLAFSETSYYDEKETKRTWNIQ